MRLSEAMIEYLSSSIAQKLLKSGAVEDSDLEKVKKIVKKVIKEDLDRERQIEEEAHRLLRQHIREIEQQGISYQKMFLMIKQKLAKERGLKL